jgi:HKD family nuclease
MMACASLPPSLFQDKNDMPKKSFVFQGITTDTHANAVRDLFTVPKIKRVLISVAFVSESGVQQIEKELRTFAKQATVFAGIRNDITSYQALSLLHAITANLHTVDTGSRTMIFHPKMYMVRGETSARLLIGSANLTLGGLNNNIEAGMVLDFDLTVADDLTVIDEIEKQFIGLPKAYPDHVKLIKKLADLDTMLAQGRLTDEMALPPPRPATAVGIASGKDTVPRMILKAPPIRRPLKKAKAASKHTTLGKKTSGTKKGVAGSVDIAATVGVEFELVWESKPLTRRDLTIPDEKGTNPTGSINLDKGLLPSEVDHRHYFREEIFSELTWAPRSTTVEEAFAKFQLVLKGVSYGEFELAIRHTTGTTSKAYLQNNAMTRLSWGPMRDYIARPDLIDRTLVLFRDKVDPTRFILEMD